MRILNKKKKEEVKKWETGGRLYAVEPNIDFVLCSPHDTPDLNSLREAILAADRLFPWLEEDPRLKDRAKSISYISDGKIVRYTEGVVGIGQVPTKTHARFSFRPAFDNLRKHQIYAYENYLRKISEELAKSKPPFVREVVFSLKFTARDYFEVAK